MTPEEMTERGWQTDDAKLRAAWFVGAELADRQDQIIFLLKQLIDWGVGQAVPKNEGDHR